MRIVTSKPLRFLRLSAVFVLVAGFFPSISHAQATSAPANSLTLEDALNYALQHYPAVRAALERVNASHFGVALARTQFLPQMSGVYQDSRATQNQVEGIWLPTPITPSIEGPVGSSSGQSFWGSQGGALLSWEPIDFGLRAASVGQARSAEDKSKADLALTQLQVEAAVANYFVLALTNQQAVKAAQADVDRWQVFDNSVNVLVKNALRPGADASRADAELARAKTQLYRAEQAERTSLDTLAALLGSAGGQIQPDPGQLLNAPASTSVPRLTPADHPLARDQMAAIREVQAQEKILAKTDYPRLFLQAEGFARGSEVPSGGTSNGNWNGLAPARGNWVAGITILFPDLFGFKALSEEKHISKANERAEQARYDQTLQDLTGQIDAARDQLKSAKLIAQETPTELSAAQQSETQSRSRYQAGLATIVEVAEAENLLAQAEMDDVVARLNVWQGLFSVAYAQGDLNPFLQLLRSGSRGQ
jgi:outer membrane protein TolC